MPHYQQTPRKQSKVQIWTKRSVHLKSYLQDLPRRLRLDIEALVKIFLTRRSLLLKLADNYLVKLWGVLQGHSTTPVGISGTNGPAQAHDAVTKETSRWQLETRKKTCASSA